MSYADIAILAILVISIIVGIIRGFWKTFSKILVLAISIVLAFSLADKVSSAIFGDSILATLSSLVSKAVLNTQYTNAVVVQVGNDLFVSTSSGNVAIADALKGMLIPTFLHAPIIASAGAVTGTITLGALVTSAYTHLVAMFIGGAIIFIASFIVLSVVASLIYKAISYKKFHKALDRILGGVFRIFTAGMFIAVLFNIIGILSGFEFMAPVMEQIEAGKISSFVYESDFLNKIFYGENMTKLIDIFKNVIVSAPSEASAVALLPTLI